MADSLILPNELLRSILRMQEDDFEDNAVNFQACTEAVIQEYEDYLECSFVYNERENAGFVRKQDFDIVEGTNELYFFFRGIYRDVQHIGTVTFQEDTFETTYSATEAYAQILSNGFVLKRYYGTNYGDPTFFGASDIYDSVSIENFGYGLVGKNRQIRQDVRYNLALLVAEKTGRIRNVFRDADGNTDEESFKMAIKSAKLFFDRLKAQREVYLSG